MNDVQKDIALIVGVSKEIQSLLRASDQYVADKLSSIPDSSVSFVYNYYKNNASEGNFKALRFIVANMLRKGEEVDLHQINIIKQKFCEHDTAFFAADYPELQNLVRRCESRSYYAFPGNLFKQLHPLFWYTQKEAVERAFRRICYYIDTHIDGFGSYDKHIITFDGIQGTPQGDIYCSWYPKNKLSYNRAYQLFIRIKHDGISAGIWKGNNISASFENQEISCGFDMDEVIEVLSAAKKRADNLNNGKPDDQGQFDLEELLQYFVESSLQVKERLESGDRSSLGLTARRGDYSDLIKYKTSFGQGSLAFVPWISFCGFGQETTKGIYPVVLFNARSSDTDNIEFCYGLSVTEKPDVEWNDEFISGLKPSTMPNYTTSFCKKSFRILSMADFEMNKVEMVKCLKSIIKDFEDQFSKKASPKEVSLMPVESRHVSSKHLNTILYGCPGTGKTYNTIIKAMDIIKPEIIEWAADGHNVKNYAEISAEFDKYVQQGRIKFVTFHQSYSYEEFVEGIKPEIDWNGSGTAEELKYVGKDGIFKDLCNMARKDTQNEYVLIIDEINRGNISKIFGELITLIEENKRETLSAVLPYSQQEFTVPKNLYIIGTMNTADRSILSIDIALRRRFFFVEQEPEENLITFEYDNFSLANFIANLNKKISMLIDKDHQLGHSEFMGIKNISELREVWFTKTLPLLNEYLYGDWEKLTALVPNFIDKTQVTDIKIKEFAGDFYYWFKKNADFVSNDDFIAALTM